MPVLHRTPFRNAYDHFYRSSRVELPSNPLYWSRTTVIISSLRLQSAVKILTRHLLLRFSRYRATSVFNKFQPNYICIVGITYLQSVSKVRRSSSSAGDNLRKSVEGHYASSITRNTSCSYPSLLTDSLEIILGEIAFTIHCPV